jgi:hypothetical protein
MSNITENVAKEKLHIICERDCGLFSLIQQVIAQIPWALNDNRIPIVYYGRRCCYWKPDGYMGKNTVWEYYFEPVHEQYPASVIPEQAINRIYELLPANVYEQACYDIENNIRASNHFGDHPSLKGKTISIPWKWNDPDLELRKQASSIIKKLIKPRLYIKHKVEEFFDDNMKDCHVIGVHLRGTDSVSTSLINDWRFESLNLQKYTEKIRSILIVQPNAKIFVATDEQKLLDYMKDTFGKLVVYHGSIRHEEGVPEGKGPEGCFKKWRRSRH